MTSRELSITIIERLHEAGHTALWAGGCVRDSMLGRTPKDYDVATSATPDQVRELFGHRRTLAIGAAFGVISVLGPKGESKGVDPIEVATFRRDGGYSDGRRPDSVEYTDAREDALRRDFTINGMFFDPLTDEVIDYVGGQEDLRAGLIRAIGDPAKRIEEDKLRMLRGVRFSATFDFDLHPETLAAIQQRADQISVVSGERIGSELKRMLGHDGKVVAANRLVETKLLAHVLPPELSSPATVDAVASHGITQLKRLHTNDFEAVVVTLLEPALGSGQDAARSKAAASAIQRTWKLTNDQQATIAWLGANWKTLHEATRHPWPQIQRLLIHNAASQAVAVAHAIEGESEGLAFCESRLAWPPEQLNPTPLLDGQTLIQHGITPGPAFKQILSAVRDAQLDQQIDSPEAAIELALRLAAE